jgi:hypothetical protein
MGHVEHDEPLDQLGAGHGEAPGDRATPVVTDDGGAARAVTGDNRLDVAGQRVQRVVVRAAGLVTQVVTAA